MKTALVRSFKSSTKFQPQFNKVNQVRCLQNEPSRTTTGNVTTVFGSSGFLGRYVVESLGSAGVNVVTPFRGEEKSVNHLKVLGDVGQIVPLRYSLRDSASIDRTLTHSNIVINLVGRNWETRNFSFNEVHVEAARNLAKASKKAGVERFIHVSTIGANSKSRSAFARSKAEGEQAVLSEFPNATILRIAPTFGPEDRLLNRFGLWSKFAPIVLSLVPLQTKIQPVYAVDVSDAVDAVLADKTTQGKTYELGGPRIMTIDQFIHIVGEQLHNEKNAVELPAALSRIIAFALEQARDPIWTRDEVEYYSEDKVVSPNALSFKDLQIQHPLTTVEEIAVNILRQYRQSVKLNA